jgi:hypothetical protein
MKKRSSVFNQPRAPTNAQAVINLDATPIPPLQAPAPSGADAVFKRGDASISLSAQLAEFMGRNDIAVADMSKKGSEFTKDQFERKVQESIKAWNTGPTFPIGMSSGDGANTLRPYVNAFANRERLNSGTPVRPELGAPYLRGIGNAWGQGVNAGNWAAMAAAQTQSANVDVAGFAQVNHTGNFIPAELPTSNLYRGGKLGGPLSGLNYGGPNAGAVFSKQDGAAGGAVGYTLLEAGAGRAPFAFYPPSGAGALSAPQAYGIASFIE